MAFEIPFFSKKNKDLPTSEAALPEDQVDASLAQRASEPVADSMASSQPIAAAVEGSKESGANIRLPFIGHRTRQWQERFLMTMLFFSILFSIIFGLAQWQRFYLTSFQTQTATEIQQNYQNLSAAATNVAQGKMGAVDLLETSHDGYNKKFAVLKQVQSGSFVGGAEGYGYSVYEAPAPMLSVTKQIQQVWTAPNAAAQSMLDIKDELASFASAKQKVDGLSVSVPKLVEQISTAISKSDLSAQDIDAINQLRSLVQRMEHGRNDILTADGVNADLALSTSKDINAARNIAESFLVGSAAARLTSANPAIRDNLVRLQDMLSQYQQAIGSIIGNQQNVSLAKQAVQKIQANNEPMKDNLHELKNLYFEDLHVRRWPFWMTLLSALFVLISIASFMIVQVQGSIVDAEAAEKRRLDADEQRQEAIRQEEEARKLNERNQAAILRLMNELQEVADGDLTIQATVSEDITGAIADSINYTVEELRLLVGRVTATAEQVDSASSAAQKISGELIGASQQQSREIEDATQLVLRMAEDINNVSQSANESAEVARQSLMVASQGATAVQNTIKGMNEIREQIQETSKRIKRLGESSQEIGEITELISDITEQTNVLALNAAIQAASAGEAGRGFSVVAEEVQRLAERSAEATKQIGALVRTIQTDTHDAVAAMENSTQGVVEGAKLSDAAGAALSDISRVSNQLAELIQGISTVTDKHATSANGLARNIQHILGITEQTQHGTEQTANSIQQLSILAEELRNSVSRFRVST